MIYLDYNATSPLRPEVKNAMLDAMDDPGNASSVHSFGRKARAKIEQSREIIAKTVGVNPIQVIFTSGGTEANTWALEALDVPARYCSGVEHSSITRARSNPTPLPVDQNGIIDLEVLEKTAKKAPLKSLFSIMWANNETGVIQPIEKALQIIQSHGHYLHSDAIQAWGKIPVELGDLDMMSIASHKVGGPKGVGALIVRENLPLKPLFSGGGQERSRRAGTENVLSMTGFGKTADLMPQILKESESIRHLRDHLEAGLKGHIYAQSVSRLPNTTCLDISPKKGETAVIEMDLKGVAVSSGSACSSGRITPSHVLLAMGVPADKAAQSIRLSLGWGTTEGEITQALKSLST